jgi:hypothetical protein
MPDSLNQVRLVLRDPSKESTFFLADVRTRLEAIARRVATPIQWVESRPFGELMGIINASFASELVQESGTHRAQYVPSNSEDGRILTAYVEVHIPGGSAATEIIRNYNYPLRRSKSFRSGHVLALDDVLSGAD